MGVRPGRRGWAAASGLLPVALLAVACASAGEAGAGGSVPGQRPEPTTVVAPTANPATTTATSVVATAPSTVVESVRERLAVLAIDDRPSPVGSYRREDWSHWDDVDGNGCDARQDTLVRWSTTTPTLDVSRRCKVLAGTWVSPYDGAVAASPAEVEIDHLVPLADAFRSGGWRWDSVRRRQFANDPVELVATSSSSNRAKSDSPPNEWRPHRMEAWCAYADRWVTVKASYGLSVTSAERDALGQMLDTCTPAADRWPSG